jgi:thiosulfate dehydrogenase [quinone] large subunit
MMTNQIAEFFKEGLRRPAPAWFIGLCRIAIGLMWLYGASWKIPPSFGRETNTGLWYWIQQALQHSAFPWYRAFLEGVVAPNLTTVGCLVFLLELGVGLFLLIGLLTRIFSAVGLLMSLNLLIGLAARSAEARMAYVMMVMFHVLFISANAGLNWGVDQLLLEKLANSSLRQTAWGRRLMKIL